MPRTCSICTHAKLEGITADIMRRVPYRTLASKYAVSVPALDRHTRLHVSAALRLLVAAEGERMSLPEAAAIAAPVLGEMRQLNVRALRILQQAEGSKDHPTALHAIRECRKNLELIAKLTGELDPRSAGETPGAPLTVVIQYVDRQQVVTAGAQPQLAEGDPCQR
jgi:hypothetical protein